MTNKNTYQADSIKVLKGLEAGADEYDTKPIEFKRLLGKIKDFLND